jgi:WD40 repeat protein
MARTWAHFAGFVSDGKQIITRQNAIVKLWDSNSGKLIRDLPALQMNSRPAFSSEITQLNPDGTRIVVSGADVFDLATPPCQYG